MLLKIQKNTIDLIKFKACHIWIAIVSSMYKFTFDVFCTSVEKHFWSIIQDTFDCDIPKDKRQQRAGKYQVIYLKH